MWQRRLKETRVEGIAEEPGDLGRRGTTVS
jgi:hypothetical protein